MSEERAAPLFTPARWREMRELLARLDGLDTAARESALARIEAADAPLAAAARELLADAGDDAGTTAIARLFEAQAGGGLPGDVGPFRLLRLLGEGGMGTVYLAERRDADFVQRVALKLLDRSAASAARLAARERRILSALAHPNITAFVDAGVAEGRAWLAMEYVDGEPLLEWSKRQALDARARVALFDQVCAAVAHAHAQLVVHRDLKPSNVYVNQAGIAKLLDFGIAQVLDPSDDRTPATRVFTPEYAAPEQLRGERVTTATDIHALGLLLYELLCGHRLSTLAQRPQAEWTTAELVRNAATQQHEGVPAPASAAALALLRGDLGRIIAHALDPEPTHRYASVASLREDLSRWLDHRPLTLPRPGPAYVIGRFVRRNRLAVAIAAIAVVALLATTAAALWQAHERESETVRALAQARRATAMQGFMRDVIAQADPNENGGNPITPAQLIAKGEALLPRFDTQPALQADMLTQLGQLYIANSDYDRAGVLIDRALALGKDAGVPDDVRARVLGGAGEMAIGRARYQQGIDYTRQGLALLRADPHADRTTIAAMNMHIAQAMDGLGDAQATEAFLRASLAEDGAALGDANASVAEQWILLGWTLGVQARYDDADAAFARGAAAYRALYGDDGFDVGHAYSEWSIIQARANRIDAAEKSAREAARIYAKTLAPTHRKALSSQNTLLVLMERRGHIVDALPQREKLTTLATTPGVTTPRQLAYYYAWLGYDYSQVGRYDEAEAALRKALDLAALGEGGANDRAGDNAARRELGVIRVLTGRYDDAERVLRDALARALASQPPDEGSARAIKGSLGDLLRLEGRRDEALQLLREATVFPDNASATNAWRPILFAQLCEAELDAGAIDDADASCTQALGFARKAYPADDFRNAFALYAGARVASARGHADQAEPLLREALRLRSPPHPATHPRVLEVEVALQQALASRGDRAAARTLRSGIEPRLQGANPYLATLRSRLAAD